MSNKDGERSFQGDINPLSTKSVIDTCVMPVLVCGCENWILIERAIHQLDSSLGWITKKVLKWPQHLSNIAAFVALGVESIKSRILTQKLGFLLHLISGDVDGVAVSAMHALVSNPDFICIIRECRELEAVYSLTPSSVALILCVSNKSRKRFYRLTKPCC